MERKIRDLSISDRKSRNTYEIKKIATPKGFPPSMSLGHLYVNGEFLTEIIFVKKSRIKYFLYSSNEISIYYFERCRAGGKFPHHISCSISFIGTLNAWVYISKESLLKIIDVIL